MRRLLLFLFLALLTACEDQETPAPPKVIPALVQPIVDRFEAEATRRGIQLDMSKLSFEFVQGISSNTNPGLVVAACTRGDDLHLVEIDTTNIFWVFAGEMGQEEVVFHELGHCLLERRHIEDVLPDGSFKSMMRAQGSPSYGNLNPLSQNLLIHRRDYYIDELFDPGSATPCWSDNTIESPYPLTVFEEEPINSGISELHVDGNDDLFFLSRQQLFMIRQGQTQAIDLAFTVRQLRVDQQGTLWVAGRNGNIGQIGTLVEDTFTVVYEDQEDFGLIYNLNQFFIDTDTRLWLGTLTGQLHIEQEDGSLVQFTEFPDSFIARIQAGPDNSVMALKGFELLWFSNRDASPEVIELGQAGLPGGFLSDFDVDENQQIWMIIQGFLRGVSLARFDLNTRRGETFDLISVNIPDTFVQSIKVDNQGEVWLATSNGLRRWEGTRFSNYCQYNTQFPILSISELTVDHNGTVWSLGVSPEDADTKLVRLEVGL